MAERIKLAFASGSDDLIPTLLDKMAGIYPQLPLHLVSEFPPPAAGVTWIRWYPARDLADNSAHTVAEVGDLEVGANLGGLIGLFGEIERALRATQQLRAGLARGGTIGAGVELESNLLVNTGCGGHGGPVPVGSGQTTQLRPSD